MLFQDTPFFTALELATLAVLPSIDGIPHRRHFGGVVALFSVEKEMRKFSRIWFMTKDRQSPDRRGNLSCGVFERCDDNKFQLSDLVTAGREKIGRR